VYISDADALAAFCERAGEARVLGVDTEFLREKTYYPKLCLIQVGTADEIAAIDPILIQDLDPLVDLLTDTRITKVFHACGQDLEVIRDALGCVPAPVFDTQLAAAFLGFRMQLGYGALVEAYTGVRLPKAESLTDWSQRPLDREQLVYAEDDVRYLPGIYERMMDELIARDRLSWLTPEMDDLCDPAKYERNPREAYRHLKRSGSLTRKQMAIAREVCAWREQKAAYRDIPRKWVCSDEVLVEICRHTPKTAERLKRIRGTEQIPARDAEELVAAIRKGLLCDPDDLPYVERHARPAAETESVVDLMNAMLRLKSEKSGVAPQLIATRDELTHFAVNGGSGRLAKGWRYELVGRSLEQLLGGQIGLTVKNGRIEVL